MKRPTSDSPGSARTAPQTPWTNQSRNGRKRLDRETEEPGTSASAPARVVVECFGQSRFLEPSSTETVSHSKDARAEVNARVRGKTVPTRSNHTPTGTTTPALRLAGRSAASLESNPPSEDGFPDTPAGRGGRTTGEERVRSRRHDGVRRAPFFVEAMDCLARVRASPSERAVLLAAVRWMNRDGELWPALSNWANMAGIHIRTLQRSLRRLQCAGIVQAVKAPCNGVRLGVRYRIVPIARMNTAGNPRPNVTARLTAEGPTPDNDGPDPRPIATQSSNDRSLNHQGERTGPSWNVRAMRAAAREHVR